MKLLISDVRQVVGRYYGVTREQMMGAGSTRKFAHPRQVAMAMIREYTSLSLPRIGQHFGRDHTTVLHAIEAVQARCEKSPDYLIDVEMIRAQLNELAQADAEPIAIRKVASLYVS